MDFSSERRIDTKVADLSSSIKGSAECAPHFEAAEMAGSPPSLESLDLQIDDLTDPEASHDGLHPKNWCNPVHLDGFP